VSEKHDAWATEACAALRGRGFRVDSDLSADKLGAKIRRAQLDKIPFMLVCGDKEVEAKAVAPRTREGTQLGAMALDAFADHLAAAARIPRGSAAD
jgi:threonyl-tRNA synthetase